MEISNGACVSNVQGFQCAQPGAVADVISEWVHLEFILRLPEDISMQLLNIDGCLWRLTGRIPIYVADCNHNIDASSMLDSELMKNSTLRLAGHFGGDNIDDMSITVRTLDVTWVDQVALVYNGLMYTPIEASCSFIMGVQGRRIVNEDLLKASNYVLSMAASMCAARALERCHTVHSSSFDPDNASKHIQMVLCKMRFTAASSHQLVYMSVLADMDPPTTNGSAAIESGTVYIDANDEYSASWIRSKIRTRAHWEQPTVRDIPLSFLECGVPVVPEETFYEAAGEPPESSTQENFKNSRFELSESSMNCILAYMRGVLDSQGAAADNVEEIIGQTMANIVEDIQKMFIRLNFL